MTPYGGHNRVDEPVPYRYWMAAGSGVCQGATRGS